MLQFDHLAVAATSLAQGTQAVEDALGVPLAPGGEHPLMGTHNRLLSLGPGEYLEVIAINPYAPAPGHARWFGLDRFAGPPRPAGWIARTDDLEQALALAPQGAGLPVAFERGDFRWDLAIADSGQMPFAGLFPGLIRWHGTAHPADRQTDRGVRLRRLVLCHPEAGALRAALAPFTSDPRLAITLGAEPTMAAEFDTPHGPRVLA